MIQHVHKKKVPILLRIGFKFLPFRFAFDLEKVQLIRYKVLGSHMKIEKVECGIWGGNEELNLSPAYGIQFSGSALKDPDDCPCPSCQLRRKSSKPAEA